MYLIILYEQNVWRWHGKLSDDKNAPAFYISVLITI